MTAEFVESLSLRGPTLDDIPAVVALMNTVSQAEEGVTLTDEDLVRREWKYPGWVPERDARFAFAPDGTLVGYIEVWQQLATVKIHTWGCVHPAYQGRGLGAALLNWAESYAGGLLPEAPQGARVVLINGANSRNERAGRLLAGRGYRLVRHYWRMAVDLDRDVTPDLPAWPDGITVRPYFPKIDDRFVYRVVQESFRDHWGYTQQPYDQWLPWATSAADFDPALWFLAVTTESGGDEIVGVALCRPSVPEDPDMAWIGTLGVLREYREQGIGSALLRYAIGEFHRLGKTRVGLTVDAENASGATRLYEQVGMRVFRQWDRYEKTLREGDDPAAG
jgi:mycothiol synthase